MVIVHAFLRLTAQLIWGNASADCELNLYGLSSRSETRMIVRVEPKKKYQLCLGPILEFGHFTCFSYSCPCPGMCFRTIVNRQAVHEIHYWYHPFKLWHFKVWLFAGWLRLLWWLWWPPDVQELDESGCQLLLANLERRLFWGILQIDQAHKRQEARWNSVTSLEKRWGD